MTNTSPSKNASKQDRQSANRPRDFALLCVGFLCVLALLTLAGELRFIVAVTAAVIVCAGALAFFTGSTPSEKTDELPAQISSEATETLDGRAISSFLMALPYPAITLAPDDRITGLNPALSETLGTRSPLGQRVSSLIRNTLLLSKISDVRASDAPQSIDIQLAATGPIVWRVHIAPLGPKQNILIVLEDLTAQRRSQQSRADFLANASHELRTPLTSLSGFIETMRGPAKGDFEAWPRFLDVMHGEAERMNRLIEDLLSLSRIEFSEHQTPQEMVDICTVSRTAIEAIRPHAKDTEASVSEGDCSASLMVTGDRDELAQVFGNLLSNAVKYAGAGGHVELSCGKAGSSAEARAQAGHAWTGAERMTLLSASPRIQDQPNDYVWLRVSDNGPGIGREHLPRLGERFYRADESRGGEIKGTGLGLAIVKHIMMRHRGGLIVETQPGKGTAFGIWLEAAPSKAGTLNPEK